MLLLERREENTNSMGEQEPVWVRWPYARIRRELTTDHGHVVQFVAQLEYDIRATPAGGNTPEWRTVARFDHNSETEQGHDVQDEGLHLDLYKNEEKHKVVDGFPPVQLSRAPRYCEEFLEQNAGHYLEQFERWHDLYGPWRT